MIPTDILNYRIVRHLGSGGMGSVYLAVNTNIDQQVAIKALKPEIARNPALRARFKQEAELLCSLDRDKRVVLKEPRVDELEMWLQRNAVK